MTGGTPAASSRPLVRVAAVDYGRRRIGLAVADPLGITVRGLPTVRTDRDGAITLQRVAASLHEERPDVVVVGLPLHESGDESPMSREARTFADGLAPLGDWTIAFFNETLTSWEAEERLRERGIALADARRKGLIDQEAAKAILRSYLAEQARTQPPTADA